MSRCVPALLVVVASLVGPVAHAQLGKPAPAPPRRDVSTIQSGVHRMLIDAKSDGFDLEGCSPTTRRRGPRPAADDRLFAIDVGGATKAGFRIAPLAGALGPAVAFGDALRITLPTGTSHETADAWQMFALLDSNRDGLLDATDLVWPSLRLARDANGDGALDEHEVEPIGALEIVRFGPRSPTRTERDANGSELSFGTFARKDGAHGRMADVLLATCDPAKSR